MAGIYIYISIVDLSENPFAGVAKEQRIILVFAVDHGPVHQADVWQHQIELAGKVGVVLGRVIKQINIVHRSLLQGSSLGPIRVGDERIIVAGVDNDFPKPGLAVKFLIIPFLQPGPLVFKLKILLNIRNRIGLIEEERYGKRAVINPILDQVIGPVVQKQKLPGSTALGGERTGQTEKCEDEICEAVHRLFNTSWFRENLEGLSVLPSSFPY